MDTDLDTGGKKTVQVHFLKYSPLFEYFYFQYFILHNF